MANVPGAQVSGGGSTGSGLTIDTMTMGYDTQGIANYLEAVRAKMLDEVVKMLEDTDQGVADIKTAFDKGWKGHSRDVFDQQFADQRAKIREDLQKEYADFEARIQEMQDNFIRQDQEMMVEFGGNP